MSQIAPRRSFHAPPPPPSSQLHEPPPPTPQEEVGDVSHVVLEKSEVEHRRSAIFSESASIHDLAALGAASQHLGAASEPLGRLQAIPIRPVPLRLSEDILEGRTRCTSPSSREVKKVVQCITDGCTRPSWNGKSGEHCCMTCGPNEGRFHGDACNAKFHAKDRGQVRSDSPNVSTSTRGRSDSPNVSTSSVPSPKKPKRSSSPAPPSTKTPKKAQQTPRTPNEAAAGHATIDVGTRRAIFQYARQTKKEGQEESQEDKPPTLRMMATSVCKATQRIRMGKNVVEYMKDQVFAHKRTLEAEREKERLADERRLGSPTSAKATERKEDRMDKRHGRPNLRRGLTALDAKLANMASKAQELEARISSRMTPKREAGQPQLTRKKTRGIEQFSQMVTDLANSADVDLPEESAQGKARRRESISCSSRLVTLRNMAAQIMFELRAIPHHWHEKTFEEYEDAQLLVDAAVDLDSQFSVAIEAFIDSLRKLVGDTRSPVCPNFHMMRTKDIPGEYGEAELCDVCNRLISACNDYGMDHIWGCMACPEAYTLCKDCGEDKDLSSSEVMLRALEPAGGWAAALKRAQHCLKFGSGIPQASPPLVGHRPGDRASFTRRRATRKRSITNRMTKHRSEGASSRTPEAFHSDLFEFLNSRSRKLFHTDTPAGEEDSAPAIGRSITDPLSSPSSAAAKQISKSLTLTGKRISVASLAQAHSRASVSMGSTMEHTDSDATASHPGLPAMERRWSVRRTSKASNGQRPFQDDDLVDHDARVPVHVSQPIAPRHILRPHRHSVGPALEDTCAQRRHSQGLSEDQQENRENQLVALGASEPKETRFERSPSAMASHSHNQLKRHLRHKKYKLADRRMMAVVEGEAIARRLMPILLSETSARKSPVEKDERASDDPDQRCSDNRRHEHASDDSDQADNGPLADNPKLERSPEAFAEAWAVARLLLVPDLGVGHMAKPMKSKAAISRAGEIDLQIWRATAAAWGANLARHAVSPCGHVREANSSGRSSKPPSHVLPLAPAKPRSATSSSEETGDEDELQPLSADRAPSPSPLSADAWSRIRHSLNSAVDVQSASHADAHVSGDEGQSEDSDMRQTPSRSSLLRASRSLKSFTASMRLKIKMTPGMLQRPSSAPFLLDNAAAASAISHTRPLPAAVFRHSLIKMPSWISVVSFSRGSAASDGEAMPDKDETEPAMASVVEAMPVATLPDRDAPEAEMGDCTDNARFPASASEVRPDVGNGESSQKVSLVAIVEDTGPTNHAGVSRATSASSQVGCAEGGSKIATAASSQVGCEEDNNLGIQRSRAETPTNQALSNIMDAGFTQDQARQAIDLWGKEKALENQKALSEIMDAGFTEDQARIALSSKQKALENQKAPTNHTNADLDTCLQDLGERPLNSRASNRPPVSKKASAERACSSQGSSRTWAAESPIDRMPTPCGRRPLTGDYWCAHRRAHIKDLFRGVSEVVSPHRDKFYDLQDFKVLETNQMRAFGKFEDAARPLLGTGLPKKHTCRGRGRGSMADAISRTPGSVNRWLDGFNRYSIMPDLPVCE